MGIDPSIYDRAADTAKADHPQATEADIQQLAEAWQRAYEDWAADMEAVDRIEPE